ncbi:hypothetical protein BS50DRAFT_277686 [Corynespora cassiicola Philippines]|uniref:Uncharacterized protein n=1 Tax=Corynespora cassiicola Philippines TaxID=1448308 RepID=A0A2T2P0K6_CORCC|nr:hypothetical protein BS50DRAFT_277686 [Corynespora cassiicola Philippines]
MLAGPWEVGILKLPPVSHGGCSIMGSESGSPSRLHPQQSMYPQQNMFTLTFCQRNLDAGCRRVSRPRTWGAQARPEAAVTSPEDHASTPTWPRRKRHSEDVQPQAERAWMGLYSWPGKQRCYNRAVQPSSHPAMHACTRGQEQRGRAAGDTRGAQGVSGSGPCCRGASECLAPRLAHAFSLLPALGAARMAAWPSGCTKAGPCPAFRPANATAMRLHSPPAPASLSST